jgi:hypothetical protein
MLRPLSGYLEHLNSSAVRSVNSSPPTTPATGAIELGKWHPQVSFTRKPGGHSRGKETVPLALRTRQSQRVTTLAIIQGLASSCNLT